jgi:hypothetical protein
VSAIHLFFVYGNRWHCYGGCGGGDGVDLTQRKYGCSFPEALLRLGIDGGQTTLKERIQIKRQRVDKARRVQRERDLLHTLSILIRATRKVMAGMTPQQFDRYGEIMDPLPAWEHYHRILSTGTREQRDEVIRGLQDMTTIRRRYLFRGNFNYRKWLFDINQNAKGVNNKGAGNESTKRKRT